MDDRAMGIMGRIAHPFRGLRGGRQQSAVRYLRRPALERPVVLAAFEGWNDAGEAASQAASYLARSWGATPLAEIDPEEFFDFTEVRPEVTVMESRRREIAWPSTSISVAVSHAGERDIVLLRGHEPQLKWRTYCDVVVEIARALKAEQVITLGAYLSEVTHGRPVPVNAVSSASELLDRYGLAPSLYEGPIGIVGVLGLALPEAGIPTTSVWASVPCYSLPVSAKASLALVRVVTQLTGRSVETAELEEESAEYERRMDELVTDDENVAAYVARLEEMEDVVGAELSAEGLAEEIERFLRGKRQG
jgi:proteasome assembly chaperone (PAC2) family protein